MKSLSKRKKVDSDFSHAAKMEEEHVKMRDKMEETVSVTWNHFEETAVGAFKSLEEDTHFTDVTLACGDGQVLFREGVRKKNTYFLWSFAKPPLGPPPPPWYGLFTDKKNYPCFFFQK